MKKSRMMHYKELIKTIKKRREVLQVTQETLAELSGVGLRTLKQFESGKGNPTLLTLQKIADVLGMEISLKLKTYQLTNERSKSVIQR
jgi:transcriptional regulator with XRE-family HTH domain